MLKRMPIGILLMAVALAAKSAVAADSGLKTGDFVMVCGDSITEQKDYSVLIEDYMLMCQPAANLRVGQSGWGGETSWGFRDRMANDVLPFNPSVATTCYGMNDGGYGPLSNSNAKFYRESQTKIVEMFKKAGLHFIVVGSPGCVDADTFHKSPEQAVVYNKTLSQLKDIAHEVADAEGVAFADVWDPMVDVMTKAKAKYGRDYDIAGGDGVHPGHNGHLVMAYAFLKGLGCDGTIGTITLDLAGNKGQATDGHKVLSFQDGTAEMESTRYPFCFHGANLESHDSTRGVLEFLPFNQDLNRFQLVVTNPGADRVKVTFGKDTKEFAAADLAKGINLAAEFLDNPFSEPFQKVEGAIRNQQNFETPLIKDLMHNLMRYQEFAPAEADSLKRIQAALIDRDKTEFAASAAAVQPVRYTIKIDAVK